MLDYKKREESKGNRFAGLAQVSTPAGKAWESMDASLRAPYEKMARDAKNRPDIKYTTTGEPINLVLKRDEDRERLKKKMEDYIENVVFKNVNKDGKT